MDHDSVHTAPLFPSLPFALKFIKPELALFESIQGVVLRTHKTTDCVPSCQSPRRPYTSQNCRRILWGI
ncbi:hypothetical protein HBI29_144500 [Parastagonospora nodorum]|nr:hypothetical protein HBH94_011380 [Parastagonospora nodorum]KAH4693322.1 hypothetical protein HBH67_223160 [Parastagonospora nodorum]KAH5472121.1 hypothetical protein HBI28_138780 [Parastagonospora nodorum]KAH5503150.1 hypothetical protein HBI29_144500 [Parastagonospora nodorum]KAH5718075.1 hypothetical protein HBI20_124350 [Parastagonospora nodorum]